MAKVSVDFSSVEDGGRIRVPEADYRVRIVGSKLRDSNSGNSMITWTFEFLDGKYEGKTITSNTVLVPKSLWVLKKLLESAGATIPKKLVKLDTSRYHGRVVGITVQDNEYEERNGKTRISSEIRDFIDPDAVKDQDLDDDDLDDVDEEPKKDKKKDKKGKKDKAEEEPRKGKKGKKKGKKKDDDDELEELDLADV